MTRSYCWRATASNSASRSGKCWNRERSDTSARLAIAAAVGLRLTRVEEPQQRVHERLAGALGPDRAPVALLRAADSMRAKHSSLTGLQETVYTACVRRLALLVCAVLVMLVLAAPASAQEPTGNCVAGAMSGTKQTYTCQVGPVVVAPYQVLTRELLFNPPKPMADGHITDMRVDLVDGGGKKVPISRLMLHHIVFSKLGAARGRPAATRSPAGTRARWSPTSPSASTRPARSGR